MQHKFPLFNRFLLLSFLFVIGFSSNAQTIWQEVSDVNISSSSERYTIPASYITYSIDLEEAKSFLSNAPKEFSVEPRNSSTVLALPMPNGEFQNFAIVESSLMPQALASKFPTIKSYLGQGLDDGTASVRLSIDHNGFHAMVISSMGTVYIDPYSLNNTQYCISYYKEDFYATNTKAIADQCVLDQVQDQAKSSSVSSSNSGGQLRTYRIAIACTGEYTGFHGGTVDDAMAAINVTLNRVNEVYEREASVRLLLVENNDQLVYGNAVTDPYSNGNAGLMIDENQDNLDDVIGNANYDIGHVFGKDSGGLAGLGVICSTGQKGRGITGHFAPVGDPFDIDYVCHEVGHQFGANHTFNGDSGNGNCGGGNRNPATAYEPGSGSTIMSYVGICEINNLQDNSDDYYHVASYNQMMNEINSTNCAVEIETGNNSPVANANPTGGNFVIPMNTPFELIGEGSDIDAGDELTYCWEQFDVGPIVDDLDSPTENAPLFRTWNPTTTPIRVFPRMEDIIAGTTVLGEILPAYERSMTFKLTVRDNRAGSGGVSNDEISIDVTGDADEFAVNPITEDWEYGATYIINWDVANTDIAPVSCDLVDVYLSLDGGDTFEEILAEAVPNNGVVEVMCPNVTSTEALIKVKGSNNIFFNISNLFEISEPSEPNFAITVTPEELNLCSGDMAIFDIQVDPILNFNTPVALSIQDVPEGIVVNFDPAEVTPGDNSTLTISSPFPIPAGNYPFQITATTDDLSHHADVAINIYDGNPELVDLAYPTADLEGVSLTPTFSWEATETANTYTLQIATDPEFDNVVHEFEDIEESTFPLGVVLDPLTEYYWNVMSSNPCADSDFSETLSFTTGEENVTEIPGCTDPTAFNFDPTATVDDGSCVPVIFGCTNPDADNYNEEANTPNGSCIISGCTNPDGLNYNEEANNDDGSCLIEGCTDPTASNYNPIANVEDNSCVPFIEGCTDEEAYNYNPNANLEDGSCDYTSVVIIQFEELQGSNFHFWALINNLPNTNNLFWTMGDGTTYSGVSEPVHYYEGNGVYEVSLTVSTMVGSYIAHTTVEVTAIIEGCTYEDAFNYNEDALIDDGSCVEVVLGCTNEEALNYDETANTDDGSCLDTVYGCTDSLALNYNPEANFDDGSCEAVVYGCTDVEALNYNEFANTDDDSCEYPMPTSPDWNVQVTSNNHIVLIPSTANITINDNPIEIGDYIGIFYLGQDEEYYCAGMMMYTGVTNTMTVYGSDPNEYNGMQIGEEFVWKTWKASLNEVRLALADYDAAMPNFGNYAVDGISGITALSNTMSQDLILEEGWSLISTYISPDYPSIGDVFAPVVDDVFLLKDEVGNVFWPAYNLNNIGDHTIGKAYKVKMNASRVLEVRGEVVNPSDYPLSLNEGWSYLGYLRKASADASAVLESVEEDIMLIKDGIGNVYWPEFNVNTIGNMEPGQGYQVRMVADRVFTYASNDVVLPELRNESQTDCIYYPDVLAPKEFSMNIAIPTHLFEGRAQLGDEFSVKNSKGEIIATSTYHESALIMTLWMGKDELGEAFNVYHWSSNTEDEKLLNLSWEQQESVLLQNNSVLIASDVSYNDIVSESLNVYPNPSSITTSILFNTIKDGAVELYIYNVLGERILTDNLLVPAGAYQYDVDVQNLENGAYFIKVNTSSNSFVKLLEVQR